MSDATINASDWIKGIALSVLASVIGGASKLAIRKSWLMVEHLTGRTPSQPNDDTNNNQNLFADRNSGAPAGGLPTPPPPHAFQDKLSGLDHSGHGAPNGESDGNGPWSPPGIELLEHRAKRRAEDLAEELAVTSASAKESSSDDFAAESFSPTNAGCTIPYCNDEDDVQTRRHRSSHDHTDHHHLRDARRTQRRALCLRLSGMFGMTVLNPLCCVLAMNYASPSILAPFSGLTLVWIILFSEYLIGERPMTIQIVAAGLIICGETIVAIFGDHTNDGEKSIEDVRASYIDSSFLIYLGCMVLWMGVLGYVIMRKSSQFSTKAFRRFAWGVAGGSITGLQNFLKDSLTIIKAVGPGGASEGMPFPWFFPLLAALAAASSFTGLLFLTVCMKKFDATFSSAMFVGSFVVSASIMSAVHYSTFQGLEGLINYIMYPFGLLVLMAGVGILLQNTSSGGSNAVATDEACEYSGDILEYHGSEDAEERGSGRNCMREPLVSPRTQVGELA